MKTANNYDRSWQKRFLDWMRGGDQSLDQAMQDDLAVGGDAQAQRREQEAYEEREKQREQRHLDAITNEKTILERFQQWSENKGAKIVSRVYRVVALLIGAGIISMLLFTVADMPPYGAADNPANNEVSARYIESGIQETGATNIVAGMILDYRAFDTLGESTVLFIAACSVLILLRIDRKKDGKPTQELIAAENDDRHHEPKNDLILQRSAALLVPVILLFGVYIILNGHLSPGGGFSGGAIIGAGLILYLNAFGFAKTSRFFSYKTFSAVTFSALLFYALAKSYSFFTGANHMASGIPLGTPGDILSSGLILPLNICVGLVVACTMYVFYALFRKGGL